MADEFLIISQALTGEDMPHYRQTMRPSIMFGSFAGDDNDYHKMRVAGRGKGRMTVAVNNDSDRDCTVTVYGCHLSTDDTNSDGAFEIGSFTASATDKNYDCFDDPFPFYIIDLQCAAGGDGETVSAWVTLNAF